MRKYRGRDAALLKRRIREELGEEAVILSTRQVIEGGILGFFGRSVIEMVAALPDEGRAPERDGLHLDIAMPGEAPRKDGERKKRDAGSRRELITRGAAAGGKELEDGTRRQEGVLENGERGESVAEKARRSASRGGTRPASQAGPSGIAERGGEDTERVSGEDSPSFVPLRFAAALKDEESLPLPERAVFLGPSGAGKTTCLGRAAWAHVRAGRKVTVLSLEEEGRLSGVRRWEELWKNMGAEYRACLDMEQMEREALAAEGAVLIDTPPLDKRMIEAWSRALRGELRGFEPVLVLEARMERGEYSAWLKACEVLGPYHLVISKADEVFDPSKAEKLAEAAAAERVYLARDPSIVIPMQRHAGRTPAERKAAKGEGISPARGACL